MGHPSGAPAQSLGKRGWGFAFLADLCYTKREENPSDFERRKVKL